MVRAWQDEIKETRLVAYVVLTQPEDSSTDDLRAFLREKLPDYMVPSVITLLTSLPLTPNGNICAAPPIPETVTATTLHAAFVAARTPVETTLIRLWSDVLNMEKVGVQTIFLTHGGHSLLPVKLIGQIEKAFWKKTSYCRPFSGAYCGAIRAAYRPRWPADPLVISCSAATHWFKILFWIHGEASYGILARYFG